MARSPDTDRRASLSTVLGQGLTGGLLGAGVMAVWFLIVDFVAGEALRTPRFVAGALLGDVDTAVGVGTIVLFTFVHFAAWALLGVIVAWALDRVDFSEPLLLGGVLGFALFDLVFYGSVWATGVDVVVELGWPAVLAGNVLAAVTLLGYVHRAGHPERRTWLEHFSRHRPVREGVVAGLIGAAIVALWFLVFDLAWGQILFTPAALGSVLFLGVDQASLVQITALTVVGYSVVHVIVFVLVGIAVAGFASAADDNPSLLFFALLFFCAFEAFFMGAMALLAEFLLGPLTWWSIALANLAAAVGMGWYLWRHHPRLRKAVLETRELRTGLDPDVEPA